jgi:hypothetical protein
VRGRPQRPHQPPHRRAGWSGKCSRIILAANKSCSDALSRKMTRRSGYCFEGLSFGSIRESLFVKPKLLRWLAKTWRSTPRFFAARRLDRLARARSAPNRQPAWVFPAPKSDANERCPSRLSTTEKPAGLSSKNYLNQVANNITRLRLPPDICTDISRAGVHTRI